MNGDYKEAKQYLDEAASTSKRADVLSHYGTWLIARQAKKMEEAAMGDVMCVQTNKLCCCGTYYAVMARV